MKGGRKTRWKRIPPEAFGDGCHIDWDTGLFHAATGEIFHVDNMLVERKSLEDWLKTWKPEAK